MRRGFPDAATALIVALGTALTASGDAVAGFAVRTVAGGTPGSAPHAIPETARRVEAR